MNIMELGATREFLRAALAVALAFCLGCAILGEGVPLNVERRTPDSEVAVLHKRSFGFLDASQIIRLYSWTPNEEARLLYADPDAPPSKEERSLREDWVFFGSGKARLKPGRYRIQYGNSEQEAFTRFFVYGRDDIVHLQAGHVYEPRNWWVPDQIMDKTTGEIVAGGTNGRICTEEFAKIFAARGIQCAEVFVDWSGVVPSEFRSEWLDLCSYITLEMLEKELGDQGWATLLTRLQQSFPRLDGSAGWYEYQRTLTRLWQQRRAWPVAATVLEELYGPKVVDPWTRYMPPGSPVANEG